MSAHELAMALRAAYLTLHRQTDAALAPWRITADQFVVLAALAERKALKQRDLVERTCSDPNTLRAMLVLLERQGLIERRAHPTDRRARSVALTKKGQRIFTQLWGASEPLRQRMQHEFSPSEIDSLIDRLGRLQLLCSRGESLSA